MQPQNWIPSSHTPGRQPWGQALSCWGPCSPWQPAAHKGLMRKGFSPVCWHSCVAAVLKVLTVSPAITYNWLLFFHVPPGNSSSSQARGGVLGLGRLLCAGEVCENGQDWLRKGNVAPSFPSLGLLSIPPEAGASADLLSSTGKGHLWWLWMHWRKCIILGWANPLVLGQ